MMSEKSNGRRIRANSSKEYEPYETKTQTSKQATNK